MGWILRTLAIIDIIAAVMLLIGVFDIPVLSIIIIGKLIILGITSMFADALSRVYGVVDITAGIMIFFSVVLFPLNMIIALVLVYKGVISLF
ncbi:MAG: hypothetical protein V1870_02155 [Candidatus Aenigmatarchaeota archaeon]